MKNIFSAICAAVIILAGCSKTVTETVTYTVNEPVYMSAASFRASVQVTPDARPVSKQGKMCFYEGYIYISESGEGIHIIDNRDPSSPRSVGFIELLGNADLAIRDGKLYADALIDLLWFNIAKPELPVLEGRLEGVFTYALPPTGNGYGYSPDCDLRNGGEKGVIVGWNVKSRTEDYTYENSGWWGSFRKESPMLYSATSDANGGTTTGLNGSMSRFALYQDYLYTVINNQMSIIDLRGAKPVKAAENIWIGADVETIFSYKDNMFMGTPTGMVIYSVANPLQPEYIRAVWHVFGCDPVVVENDIAWVTIHSGNNCGQTNNDLIAYDVSDVRNPRHIVTYAMTSPKGLGIDGGTLFLCDGGLKIFNATDPQTLLANRIAHYSGMDGYDVIPAAGTLIMIASDGLYQYDYSDLTAIRPLSRLPILRPE